MNKLTLVVCGILFLGLFPMEYGYYTFLRLAVCGYSFYLFNHLFKEKEFNFVNISYLVCGILYNPVFKVSFDRDIWICLNIATIIFFMACRFGRNFKLMVKKINSWRKIRAKTVVIQNKEDDDDEPWYNPILGVAIIFLWIYMVLFFLNGARCSL